MSWWQLTKIAEDDMVEIEDYIAVENRDAANRVVDELVESFDLLAENREIGRLRPELGEDVRSWVVGARVVFYCLLGDGVSILRIRHVRRDVLDIADLG